MSYEQIARQYTKESVSDQSKTVYEDYNKIKKFEDVGHFLTDYVVDGGAVVKDKLRNDTIIVSSIVASINNNILSRDGHSFSTSIPNAIYYLDFTKEGDWHWGTSHVGVADEDYIQIAVVTTNASGLVNVITDARGHVGGFRLKDEYGLEGYAKQQYVDKQLLDITYNVRNFGAVGDWDGLDGTDNTPFLQAALDAARNAGGGKVLIPRGKYLFRSQIIVYENTVILGENATLYFNSQTGYSTSINGNNVEINGLKFEGTNTRGISGTGNGAARVANNVNNITFSKCTFDGFNSSILFVSNNRNLLVTDCVFRNAPIVTGDAASGYGIILQSSQDATIRYCTFEKTINRHQIYVSRNPTAGLYSRNHIISENKFFGRTDGSASHSTGYEHLLKIMGSQEIVVIGNLFDGGVSQIMLDKYTGSVNDVENKSVKITKNIFKNVVGIQNDNAVISFLNRTDFNHQITIDDNTVVNCSCNFITSNNLQYCDISNNNVSLAAPQTGLVAHGFYCYKASNLKAVRFYNNYIKVAALQRGMYFFNQSGDAYSGVYDGLEITNNTFDGGFYGIFFQLGTTTDDVINIKINRNTFRNNTSDSIRFATPRSLSGEIIGNVSEDPSKLLYLVGIPGKLTSYNNRMGINKSATLFLVEPFGNGNVITYGTAAPTSEAWVTGDRSRNSSAAPSGYEGWVCTSGGTPGTWKGYGTIQA